MASGLSLANQKRRYSRLLRSLSQKDTKVVIALGGGGIRLFAHPPILKFLERIGAHRYIKEIWGCSGGAIVGLLYSMGVSPEVIQEEGLNSLHIKREVEITPSLTAVMFKILSEYLFPSLSFFQGKKKNQQTLKGFHDCQTYYQKFVEKVVKKIEPQIPFYCLAYNMESHQTDILTGLNLPDGLYSQFIYQTDPLEAIVASSSVPIVFIPKLIDDKNGKRIYVDGATVEDVPSESIYKKWIFDREMGLEEKKRLLVIAVNFTPYFSSIGFFENWLLKRFPGFHYLLLSAHYADLMRQARTKVQKQLLTDDPSVELWDINIHIPGGGLLDVGQIPYVIRTAERECTKKFLRINDSLLG